MLVLRCVDFEETMEGKGYKPTLELEMLVKMSHSYYVFFCRVFLHKEECHSTCAKSSVVESVW